MEAFSLVPNLKIQRQTTQSSPRRRISTPSSIDDDTASGIEAWIYAAECVQREQQRLGERVERKRWQRCAGNC
eukprot:scaffold67_cov192-Alexandrium_tamarense.AAC.12